MALEGLFGALKPGDLARGQRAAQHLIDNIIQDNEGKNYIAPPLNLYPARLLSDERPWVAGGSVLEFTGRSITITAMTAKGTAQLRIDSKDADPIDLVEGLTIEEGRFRRLYLTHVLQNNKTIKFFIAR